jgi:hypothetical protein
VTELRGVITLSTERETHNSGKWIRLMTFDDTSSLRLLLRERSLSLSPSKDEVMTLRFSPGLASGVISF